MILSEEVVRIIPAGVCAACRWHTSKPGRHRAHGCDGTVYGLPGSYGCTCPCNVPAGPVEA